MNSKLAGARVLSAVALVVMAAGLGATFLQCSPTPIILPAGTFNRPTDLAFACLSLVNESGPEGSGRTVTRAVGRPMALCHPTGHGYPAPDEDHRTFGFLTNSERGDLSVLDTYYCRSGDTNCVCASGGTSCFPKGGTNVDLDKAQPGDNGVPVGALPERVSASQDGCRVVTANRGSCDFAVVNTGVLLTEKLVADQSAERSTKRPDDVLSLPLSAATTRVSVRTASGRTLQVAPGEVAFLPQDTASVPEQTGFCDRWRRRYASAGPRRRQHARGVRCQPSSLAGRRHLPELQPSRSPRIPFRGDPRLHEVQERRRQAGRGSRAGGP